MLMMMVMITMRQWREDRGGRIGKYVLVAEGERGQLWSFGGGWVVERAPAKGLTGPRTKPVLFGGDDKFTFLTNKPKFLARSSACLDSVHLRVVRFHGGASCALCLRLMLIPYCTSYCPSICPAICVAFSAFGDPSILIALLYISLYARPMVGLSTRRLLIAMSGSLPITLPPPNPLLLLVTPPLKNAPATMPSTWPTILFLVLASFVAKAVGACMSRRIPSNSQPHK
jgi:hypothetical protein